MSSLFGFLLFVSGHALAEGNSCDRTFSTHPQAQQCLKKICEAEARCSTARAGADQSAMRSGQEAAQSRAGKSDVFNNGSRQLSAVSNQAKSAYQNASNTCQEARRACDCSAPISDPSAKQQVERAEKSCEKSIDGHKSALAKASGEGGRQAGGGDSTGDSAQGKGENKAESSAPMMPPMTPQDQKDSGEDKKDQVADKPAETTKATTQPQSVAEMEPKDDGCKSGGFANDPKCTAANYQTASQNYCARAGKSMCPGCAGFQKQCSGDAASCLRQMSAGERARIQSTCADGPAVLDPAVVQELGGARGLATASVGGGASSGSIGGTSLSGNASASAQAASLTDLNKLRRQLETLSEGDQMGNMRVDASGGFSGGPVSPASETEINLNNLYEPGANARSPASAAMSVAPDKDVEPRLAPNVFSISSQILRARCARGKMLHCQPRAK